MKLALCAALLFAQSTFAALDKYSSLVVADKDTKASIPANGIRVTYLGVNGYQFEVGDHALLVDPYFSRVGFWKAALNETIAPNESAIAIGFAHMTPRADAVLVTHGHFDHLLDVPDIMRRTHARLLSGPTAVHIAESAGISPSQCDIVKPGGVRKIEPWTIRVLSAAHDRIFGATPFRGTAVGPVAKPVKPSDWKLGEPLAFVIEANGKRIYIDSGGMPANLPEPAIQHVDLAIVGMALPDSRNRYAEIVRQLHPRYILPSHQDDFFVPLDRGFVFGELTNFPGLIRQQRREHLPGRLILLDYFHPWTLR